MLKLKLYHFKQLANSYELERGVFSEPSFDRHSFLTAEGVVIIKTLLLAQKFSGSSHVEKSRQSVYTFRFKTKSVAVFNAVHRQSNAYRLGDVYETVK